MSSTSQAKRSGSARLPTEYGEFQVTVYIDDQAREHMILKSLNPEADTAPLVRLHSECLTGDVFGSLRCDCGDQLDMALKRIMEDGNGALLYLRQEGRGIGLGNKMHAYALQDQGMDTVEANEHLGFPADGRDFGIAVDMLKQEGIEQVRLMTNNPRKIAALENHGIKVTRQKIIAPEEDERTHYITTKTNKLGHLFE